jgi:pyocin large subunit-like protein
MLDLGLITKKENITEPEDANGKKHSVHTKQYIFNNRNFNDNMHKLYDYFIRNSQLI